MHSSQHGVVSFVVTGGAGKRVSGVLLDNKTAATVLWFQLHNLAAVPTNEAPLQPIRVAAGAMEWVSFDDLDPDGIGGIDGAFNLGIAGGWSSTRDTYTAHGTATDVSADVFYETP